MTITDHRTLYGELAALSRVRPDDPWLAYEDGAGICTRWTAAAFCLMVRQAAGWLRERGVGSGQVVALSAANHPAHVQLVLAASYLGATFLPLDPAGSDDGTSYCLKHAGARLLVVEDERAAALQPALAAAGWNGSVVPLSRFEAQACEAEPASPDGAAAGGGPVQLLYTSGTTARPKGVMLTDRAIIFGAEVFRAATGLRESDHHLIALPFFHAAAQCHALWPSLVARCRITVLSRFSASRFFEQAGRHGGTMAALFGAPLRFLLNQPPKPTDRAHRLRNVTFAQNLRPEQYLEWHRRFAAPLQQLWGMTETCSLPVMSPLTGDRRLEAMGRPVLGYELAIVDAEGGDVPVGSPGELIVRGIPGETLMLGYLGDAASTASALRPRAGAIWMYSGDTVRADSDGFLHFVERSKDLIKRAGENISCAEIESAIGQMPGVAEVCAVGLPDEDRDEWVAVAIVPQAGVAPSEEAVQAWCRRTLAPFKVPGRVALVTELPRTSVGKLQRHLVRKHFLENHRK